MPNEVVFRAVWSSLLGLAFLFAVNPVLLAVIVLLVSRPRPVQGLAAYWVGSVTVNLPCLLIPLVVLHSTPTLTSFAEDMGTPDTSFAARCVQLGMGVLALSIAAVMTVRMVRERARLPIPAGNTSVMTQDSDTSRPITPFGRPQDAATEGGSVFRRVLSRLQNAWENGALWVAFVFGLGGFPPPLLVLYVETIIVGSGAAIATQVIAVIVFVMAMFAVVEITLVSYLVAPAKTLAVLRPLHDWALAHRRQVLVAIFAVVGFFQLARGIGIA